MPRSRSPSKPRSKSVSSAARKRPASKGRKPARKSTPSRKTSPPKRRGRPSKSPGRKTGKSPAPAKKTPSKTPAVMTAKTSAKSPASRSRSASRGRKPTTTPTPQRGRSRSRSKTRAAKTDQKTTTIATKVEKKPSYTPPTPSELRSRRGIFSSGSESSRRLTVSDALRSRATSGARGRKDTGIVQNIVALPKRAWNAVRIPNVGRRLKRHAKNNWKKYLLFLVAFVAVSVAYHFSRELARSVEHLRTQVADALEESKKAFGDVIKRVSRKVDEWTESSNKSQSKASFTTHEHHHHHHEHVHAPSSPPPKAPRQPAVTPQPLDDAI